MLGLERGGNPGMGRLLEGVKRDGSDSLLASWEDMELRAEAINSLFDGIRSD